MKSEQIIENPEFSHCVTETKITVKYGSKEFIFFMDSAKAGVSVGRSIVGQDLFVLGIELYPGQKVSRFTVGDLPVYSR